MCVCIYIYVCVCVCVCVCVYGKKDQNPTEYIIVSLCKKAKLKWYFHILMFMKYLGTCQRYNKFLGHYLRDSESEVLKVLCLPAFSCVILIRAVPEHS